MSIDSKCVERTDDVFIFICSYKTLETEKLPADDIWVKAPRRVIQAKKKAQCTIPVGTYVSVFYVSYLLIWRAHSLATPMCFAGARDIFGMSR